LRKSSSRSSTAATAKANQAERFGVGLAELYGKMTLDDPVRVHIGLQEHCRPVA